MISPRTVQQADLYFRLLLHVVVPVHKCLVDEMCETHQPPKELASRLESIGHQYLNMAADLNGSLIDSGCINEEFDPDEYAETTIDCFVKQLIESGGVIQFCDGTKINTRDAFEALPAVEHAIKTALWIAKAGSNNSKGSS